MDAPSRRLDLESTTETVVSTIDAAGKTSKFRQAQKQAKKVLTRAEKEEARYVHADRIINAKTEKLIQATIENMATRGENYDYEGLGLTVEEIEEKSRHGLKKGLNPAYYANDLQR